MTISYYGEGCFKIQSGEAAVLIDPPSPQSGLTTPRFKADIILKTLTPFPINSQLTADDQRLIYGPGEYNIKEIDILGLANKKESAENFLKTIYDIKVKCFFQFRLIIYSIDPKLQVLDLEKQKVHIVNNFL